MLEGMYRFVRVFDAFMTNLHFVSKAIFGRTKTLTNLRFVQFLLGQDLFANISKGDVRDVRRDVQVCMGCIPKCMGQGPQPPHNEKCAKCQLKEASLVRGVSESGVSNVKFAKIRIKNHI